MTDAMTALKFKITKVLRETADTFTWELVPVSGAKKFVFKPGQFNMIYVYGVGEVPVSISGNPANPQKLVHTIRAVGAVTKAMGGLKRGSVVGLRGPFGTDWPLEKARGKDIVIVAGGIGLAPLRPAIYHVLNNRKDYGKISLLLGAKTPGDILYAPELSVWRSRFDIDVDITVDKPAPGWLGNVGLVTALIPRARFEPKNSAAFVCGPEIMMKFTAAGLVGRGMAKEDIFLTLERNMKCGLGLCGHCQMGHYFVCKDGPVFSFAQVEKQLNIKEI